MNNKRQKNVDKKSTVQKNLNNRIHRATDHGENKRVSKLKEYLFL